MKDLNSINNNCTNNIKLDVLMSARLVKLVFLTLLFCSILLFSQCGDTSEDPCANGPELTLNVEHATIGLSDGSITALVSGGSGTYEYQLDDGSFQGSNSFSDLPSGNYRITVRDANQCTVIENTTVEEIDPCASFNMTLVTNATFDNENTGKIEVVLNGGTADYSVSIDGVNFQSVLEFTSLQASDYTVTARDAIGCELTATTTVEEVPFTSYLNDIKPIIDTNCSITNCHGDNESLPDWDDFSVLQANAENVKQRAVIQMNMPPAATGLTLSTDEKNKISNWVDAGAPNN